MLIQIKSWFDNSVLFEADCETVAACVRLAIEAGKALILANLTRANLDGANLYGANLSRADLYGANLSRADLSGANLSRANLSGADLSGANLSGANLSRANLSGADLSGANLSGADLSRADLSGADLSRADLSSFRNDLWAVLLYAPHEVIGLRAAIVAGQIDGSCYEGECCCLVGTLAKAQGVNYRKIDGLTPNSSRPAEVWFGQIRPGHTPENSQVCKLTLEWVDEWLKRTGDAFDLKTVAIAGHTPTDLHLQGIDDDQQPGTGAAKFSG